MGSLDFSATCGEMGREKLLHRKCGVSYLHEVAFNDRLCHSASVIAGGNDHGERST